MVQGLQSRSRRSRVPGKALSGRLKLDELKEFNGFLAPHRPWMGCEAVNIDKKRVEFFNLCLDSNSIENFITLPVMSQGRAF